jgi:hypothetical protein
MSLKQAELIKRVRDAAVAEVEQHMKDMPIQGIAWDLAATIAKNNGWDWCKSSVSGKEWAIMVLMLDKATSEKTS